MATLTSGALAPVERRVERWGGSYVLRARDDALSGAGVRKDDYLVVQRGGFAHDGALVVIKGEGGALVLRTLERYGQRVRLQPGSGPLRPLLLPPDGAGIWGIVIAVLRKFAGLENNAAEQVPCEEPDSTPGGTIERR